MRPPIHARRRTDPETPETPVPASITVVTPDDPAVIIGLSMQFARLGDTRHPVPDVLLARLRVLAANGVPAARLTLMMLISRGKAPRTAAVHAGDRAAGGDEAGDAAGSTDAAEAST